MSDDLVKSMEDDLRIGCSASIGDTQKAVATLKDQAAEITRLRAALATARREGMEEAAKIAEGEIYNERYRTWPWWEDRPGYGRGNVSEDSQLVLHCDAIAAAIRAAARAEVMDWQPIETAPRDKTWFVIINADDPDSVEVGRYNPLKLHRYEDAGNGLFRKVAYIGCEWDGFNNFHNATHWRPAFDKLPDPTPPKDREP